MKNTTLKNLVTGVFLFSLLTCLSLAAESPRRMVAPTPPMGWNSWNLFAENINEQLIREIADAMVRSGMRDAGYQYVCIDDSWVKPTTDQSTGRDENGVLIADPAKFPTGMAALADYLHNQGLKFGIYTGPGPGTCQGRVGSEGHEKTDIETFAAWGVDYIKLDFCGRLDPTKDEARLALWRKILDQTPRPIVLSTNPGSRDYEMIRKYADLWRTTGDISAKWDFVPGHYRHNEIAMVIRQQDELYEFNGPGTWCDPDMLEIGNGSLTDDENRAHLSLWAMLSAPLIAGHDIRNMSDTVRQILTNSEIIAIDQDPAGQMARRVSGNRYGSQIWTKRLAAYAQQAAALLNLTDQPIQMTLRWDDLGIKGAAHLRDLWQHKDLGLHTNAFAATVPAHGVVMLKVTAYEDLAPYPPVGAIPAEGLTFEAEDHFGDGRLVTQPAGFSGTGCMTRDEGLSVYWSFQSDQPRDVKLELRYNNPSSQTIAFQLGQPGCPLQTINLTPTDPKSPWQTITLPYKLRKGNNRIYLDADESTTPTNIVIDYLKIIPVEH